MSKPQPKQLAHKPAETAGKIRGRSEVQAPEQAPVLEAADELGQLNGLPPHPTSRRIRQASILRMQRRQGNGYVQRILGRDRSTGHDLNGRLPGTVQMRVDGEEAPSAEQQASAQSAAQAAEGSASQAESQAQQATSASQAAASQEQPAGPGAASQSAPSQAGIQSAGGSAGPNGSGAASAASQQPGQAEQGPQSAGPEMAGGPGQQGPTSPQEDAGFLAIVEQIKQQAEQQKSHPQAEQKAEEAQQAAESPAAETASKANAGHVAELQSAETPPVDQVALKAQLMQKIQAVAPRTAGEADQLKSSNKLGALKAELKGKMAEEKGKATDPMKKKSDAGPSQAGVAPKPVQPLKPPKPPSPLTPFNAAPAVPKPKPASEIEKPLKEQGKSLDEQMAEADITEEQLKKSNEPEFQSALEAKKEAQQNAVQAPQEYRQGEQEQITQAREEAGGSIFEQLQGMQGDRQQAMEQVGQQQGQAKSGDEQKRQEVADRINGIYERTKTNVDTILGQLDARVNPVFESGAAAAQAAFETFVTAKMEAYKQQRYGGMLGWARWAKDKLLGLPAEVNQFYNQGRQRYLDQMDAVTNSVVAIISSTISQAKQEVVRGRAEIQEYVNQLPAELQQVGQEAAAEIQGRFDQLEQDISQAQQEMVDTLAQRYMENLQAIDARIEAMRAQNQGLVQAATSAILGVFQTIRNLTQRLLSVLSSAASAVTRIMRDPVGFLGNLLGAIRNGLTTFAGNIATHLRRGLVSWLFKTLADAGIELPGTLDLQGILSVVMRVLGVTWRNIRARAAAIFGERVMGILERTFDIFRAIREEGLGGLFRFVRDQVTGIKDTIMDGLREVVTSEIVQAGIQKIIGLLGGPAGAFVQAVESIYNVITWFIGNGRQIASLVGTIMDSVSSLVSGSISQVAQMIERTLARSIPTAISFLADLLGLGDLSRKIIEVIERVRSPVNNVLDWIIDKARRVVSGLGGLLGGDNAPGASETE